MKNIVYNESKSFKIFDCSAFLLLIALLSTTTLFAQTQQLIIFTQVGNEHFTTTALPEIEAFCEAKNIELTQLDVTAGVPTEITATPAIVYQNERGRSIYASRYAEFSTIQNFIRTSRFVPQKSANLEQKEVLVWKNGRTQIVSPVKITPAGGKRPKAFSDASFAEQVKSVFASTMQQFEQQAQVKLARTDRMFYLDVHPYFGENEEVFLSLEIYSQYSCKDPIFSNFSQPLKGKANAMEALLSEAAQVLEAEVKRQMQASEIGDAFVAIPNQVSVKTWAALGLSLPEASQQSEIALGDAPEMPNDWQFYAPVEEGTPIVQFRFFAPLDRYIGEIRSIEGELQTANGQLQGTFVADMQSLTMGMESFDYNVLNKYVKAYKFPASSFEFEDKLAVEELRFGETLNTKVNGIFELMRRKRPVEVAAQLTPILDASGKPLLQVSASFQLNVVDDFKIKGPDGPEPARKMMQFDLNFLMAAANEAKS